jgi:hypothetical protein
MALRLSHGKQILITPPPPLFLPVRILGVPYRHQEQTNWCWAACCEMVFLFNNIAGVRQCNMASYQFAANCCAAPSSSVCNQGNWPDGVYAHWGFFCSRSNISFPLSSVQGEINGDRPVEPVYFWNGGGSHVAIIRGFYANGDLEINDPWYGTGRHTYNNVLTAYGLGHWGMTYYNLRKR